MATGVVREGLAQEYVENGKKLIEHRETEYAVEALEPLTEWRSQHTPVSQVWAQYGRVIWSPTNVIRHTKTIINDSRTHVLNNSPIRTNLRVLKPSRKAPRAGDLFTMQLLDRRFLFGLVVTTDAKAGPSMPGAILIYIYRPQFDSIKEPGRAELSPERLLVPPMMTNRLPWSKGYFQNIAHWNLDHGDVLSQHCFLGPNGRYFDEAGAELPGPVEPVGDYGLHSYRTIDDAVSEALGIDRVP